MATTTALPKQNKEHIFLTEDRATCPKCNQLVPCTKETLCNTVIHIENHWCVDSDIDPEDILLAS